MGWKSKEGVAVILLAGIVFAYLAVVLSSFFWDGANL